MRGHAAGPPADRPHDRAWALTPQENEQGTLTQLHEIIEIPFERDGDHLPVFTVDGTHYADPFHELDRCADSDQLTLTRRAAQRRCPACLTRRPDRGVPAVRR